MRDPYYAELTILQSGALRMRAMERETGEPAAERTIDLPRQGSALWNKRLTVAREELVAWVRNWIKRHSPKQVAS